MGGTGSGRWYGSGRATTDQVKSISIKYLQRRGPLKPGDCGTLSWTYGRRPNGAISYQCNKNDLRISYRHKKGNEDWQSVRQTIHFDRTPCHLGGHRLWLLCPHCNRRVDAVYGLQKLFLCRHCYRLPYSSQNKSRLDRLMTEKHKLGARIFDRYESGEGWGKKKGMHWKTYDRLHRRYMELDHAMWVGVAAKFNFPVGEGPD